MREKVFAKDYAASRHLPLATVRKHCRNGDFPALAIGRRYIIDPDVADEFYERLAKEDAEQRNNMYRAKIQAKEDERRHRELAAEFKNPGKYLQRLQELKNRTVSKCIARYQASD